MEESATFYNLIDNSKMKTKLPNLEKYKTADIKTIQQSLSSISTSDSMNFGSSVTFNVPCNARQFINNFILKITLSNLATSVLDDVDNDYNFYTNEIGLTIINGFELKIDNKIIIYDSMPYDVYLDMYNELNDPNFLEWSLIEKYDNLMNIKNKYKKGVLNNLTVYVPLKLWCDQSINNAIPSYLLQSKTNPINIKISTKTKAQIQMKKETQNIFDNPNAKIEEIKLLYDEHSFSEDVEKYLNDIYNSANDYNVFFDRFLHQKNTINSSLNNPYPSINNNKQASLSDVQLSMTANESGPLREIIFLFRNTTRLLQPKTNGPAKTEFKSGNGVVQGDYLNYKILDKNEQEIFNFDTLTVEDNLSSEKLLDNFEAKFLAKVIPFLNKRNVPRKNIYVVNFGSSSLRNFYKYEPDSGLTFKFNNMFLEYSDKTNSIGPYNYQIESFFRFVNKLTISSEGAVRLNDWELPQETAIRPIYEDKLEDLQISDIASTILIDFKKGETLFYIETIKIQEDNKIKIKLLTSKTKKELLFLLTTHVLVFNYYSKIQDLFLIIDKNIPEQTTAESSINESDEDIKQIKKNFISKFKNLYEYELEVHPHFTKHCILDSKRVVDAEVLTAEEINNYNSKIKNILINDIDKTTHIPKMTSLRVFKLEKNKKYYDTCVTFTGIRFFVYIETKIPNVIKGTTITYKKNNVIVKSKILQIKEDKYILENGSSIAKTDVKILDDICRKNGISIGKSNNIILNLSDELNSKKSKCITIFDIYDKFKKKYNDIMNDLEEKNKLDNGNYKDFYEQCVSELKLMTEKEAILSLEGPKGYDTKPENCAEFDVSKDASIVEKLQGKLKFLINIADASNKKFTIKVNDKLVKNIKQDLDKKTIKSITYTYKKSDNKIIQFNTTN